MKDCSYSVLLPLLPVMCGGGDGGLGGEDLPKLKLTTGFFKFTK
jgi:hypothetical protein